MIRAALSRFIHSAQPEICADVAQWAQARGIPAIRLHDPIEAKPFPEKDFGTLGFEEFKTTRRELDKPQHLVVIEHALVRGEMGLVRLPDSSFCLQGNWAPHL